LDSVADRFPQLVVDQPLYVVVELLQFRVAVARLRHVPPGKLDDLFPVSGQVT
jgi:hypothetical protein